MLCVDGRARDDRALDARQGRGLSRREGHLRLLLYSG
jgi:hypothetical protein